MKNIRLIYENIWLLKILKLISFVCTVFNILPRSNSWIIFWLFYRKDLSQSLLHIWRLQYATGFENRILTIAASEKTPLSVKFWLSFSKPLFFVPRINPLILFLHKWRVTKIVNLAPSQAMILWSYQLGFLVLRSILSVIKGLECSHTCSITLGTLL